MLASESKVVKLDNLKVYDQIERYFNNLAYNSEKTLESYSADIKQFFGIMKKKEIEFLTEEDIQITLDDFEDYVKYLFDLKDKKGNKVYVGKTINRKISAIKGVLDYLFSKKLVKDISYFGSIKSLPELKNHHGVLDVQEVFEMSELALQEKEKGNVKRLLILFSLDSCARKSEVLGVKWSNMVIREDGVLVKGIGKGNKDFRQLISHDFYEELLTIKTDSEFVFDIGKDAVDKMFQRLRDKMNIKKERQIVFHSIRKSGITYRFRMTGDILEAQRAANHSNITTTQIYLEHEDYGALGAVSSKGKVDLDMFKNVDLKILVEAISNCPKSQQYILNMKIQELLENN